MACIPRGGGKIPSTLFLPNEEAFSRRLVSITSAKRGNRKKEPSVRDWTDVGSELLYEKKEGLEVQNPGQRLIGLLGVDYYKVLS